MTQLLVLAVSLGALRLLWLLIRNYIVRTPVDRIPGPPSGSVFSGNVEQLLARDNAEWLTGFLDSYGPVAKINGFFGARWLHVYDPKALHSIYVKDQESYSRGPRTILTNTLLFGPGLLSTFGQKHRKQRKSLNPAFSAAHIRGLAPIFYRITGKLKVGLEARVINGLQEIDILAWMGRTALELVGQGMMGYSFDPLVEEVHNDFAEAVKAFVPTFAEVQWARALVPVTVKLGPASFRRFMLDRLPIKSIQRMKTISDVMHERSRQIYNEKKAAIEHGDRDVVHAVGEGKDMLCILLKENMKAADEDRLPDDELLAQLNTFIFAGVDTTSNAVSRILHLLCQHQDVQDNLRAELRAAIEHYGAEIPYDELTALPYLDAVCRETLRLFAPVNISIRQAWRDTMLPLLEPIHAIDGTIMTEVPVPKGTTVIANLPACNTNKAIWGEDARKWKPERWLKPLPPSVEEAHIPGIYANTMTFLAGGYACIGFKFSQLEMKSVLSMLVDNFKFELPEKPITWNFAGINYPSMGYTSPKPEMVLKVSFAVR
ncbi:cytochrome P450 [Dichomitus squalens]|uniref:Cytochrome P450 n=1 Tax=Dichomitus squalens TaxID=114155 RepID=A0A4Q9MNF1_9APHY|nr:cytochrome P450 [Dichomitus squalens]